MVMKGDGPMVVGLMWLMAVLCTFFTVLRTYTRTVIVKSFGADDIVFIVACLMFVMYTIFLTISASIGFGQNTWEIPDVDIPPTVLYSAIGQTFSIFGMAIAKWSLGLFLLRLVCTRRHKIAIWLPLILCFITSLLCAAFFWFGCTPIEAVWNRALPGSHCNVLPRVPMYYVYGSTLVFADFYFALFPWLFIWKLNMKKREKIVVLCSMSLGIFAAAFGILRCSQISGLTSPNFVKAAVRVILFAAAEQCVTMICIGIPVFRPLYRQCINRRVSRDSSNCNKISGTHQTVALRSMIGGETRSRGVTWNRSTIRDSHFPTAGELARHTSTSEAGFDADENRSDDEISVCEQRGSSKASMDPEKG
uniref:Rhodopsin domain-containing protein n=1 Tax=Bionectria ochroleuca TaxID=29856 RepID=A0A8H7NR43_BIOOC